MTFKRQTCNLNRGGHFSIYTMHKTTNNGVLSHFDWLICCYISMLESEKIVCGWYFHASFRILWYDLWIWNELFAVSDSSGAWPCIRIRPIVFRILKTHYSFISPLQNTGAAEGVFLEHCMGALLDWSVTSGTISLIENKTLQKNSFRIYSWCLQTV